MMATSNYGRQKITRRVRRRSLAGALLGVAGMVVLPVALAWACAPQSANLAFDRSSYKAGDAVGVIGGGFMPNTPVQLTLQPPSGAAQALPSPASTNAQGYFEASFTLPFNASSGDYVLQATTGNTTARDTFKVVAEGAILPPPLTPPPPPAGPPAPAAPGDPPVNRKAALRRGLADCKKRHGARKGMRAAKKRKLARKRAACVKAVKRKYP